MTHKGSIKTNFSIWTPDSKLFVWIRRKLIKIGRLHEDYSLFLFHKKGRFRKTVKRIVKAKYPPIPLLFDTVSIHFVPLLHHTLRWSPNLEFINAVEYFILVLVSKQSSLALLDIKAFILNSKAYIHLWTLHIIYICACISAIAWSIVAHSIHIVILSYASLKLTNTHWEWVFNAFPHLHIYYYVLDSVPDYFYSSWPW